jgi:N-acetylglucosaminyldiphosphoundecaprenol N-acetyl-beta-D-mannosaminyltransferase
MPVSMNPKNVLFVEFLNTKVNIVNYFAIHDLLSNTILNGLKGYICLTDVGNIISATSDGALQLAINTSLLSLADGAPLAYFALLAGYKGIERISGMHLMELLFAEKDGFSHYLLGDTDQIIKKVISKVKDANKDINITGYSPPFKDFSEQDNLEIIKIINEASPDIIWVCFGGGKQEKWMMNNIGSLEKGIMIGVGSAMRWFTGDLKVPPAIFQKLCLQWSYRLVSECVKEPRRCKSFFVTRQLRKFPIFLMNFPFELARARMISKRQKHFGIIP